MKNKKLITTAKQFLGPLICVAFGWLAIRWTVGFIAFAKLWPWLDCTWGGCSYAPPQPQTYVITASVAVIGLCGYVMLGSFVHMGWRWFRSR